MSEAYLDAQPRGTVENAIVRRLADNWHRRASVKREEPDLHALFEPERPDYPVGILPFADHPTFVAAPEEQRRDVLSWAWVAYNRNTIMAEEEVANPAFFLILNDYFPGTANPLTHRAVMQAIIDENYHSLMHANATAVTRAQRGKPYPDDVLPDAYTARRLRQLHLRCSEPWERNVLTLAFATVSEISINAYLNLLADDRDIQPINRSTASLHNRDEWCHASITAEIAKDIYANLDRRQRAIFVRALPQALEAFVANDYGTWYRVVELVGLRDGRQMVRDCEQQAGRRRLVRDYSGLRRLAGDMDLLDTLDFDWSAAA